MGRFRRKKHYYKGEINSNRKGNNEGQLGFPPKDKKRLISYLEEYRDGAKAIKDNNRGALRVQGPENNAKVAGIQLPVLTEHVLLQPYLELPSEFTLKQRQFIHDSCVERAS